MTKIAQLYYNIMLLQICSFELLHGLTLNLHFTIYDEHKLKEILIKLNKKKHKLNMMNFIEKHN